jgi:hypothetical protein
MTNYKQTQYGLFIIAFSVLISAFIGYSYYYQLGDKPLPLTVTLLLIGVLILSLITFYKLTIRIDKEKITATFGFGIIKKTMLLSEIDKDSIEKVIMPWYVGIGIRITSKGTLYNVKTGATILIKNKQQTKTFLVGTDDFEGIKTALDKLMI